VTRSRSRRAGRGICDGQVKEPHGAQPVVQGAQERHQEAQAPPPDLHQGGKIIWSCCSSSTFPVDRSCSCDNSVGRLYQNRVAERFWWLFRVDACQVPSKFATRPQLRRWFVDAMPILFRADPPFRWSVVLEVVVARMLGAVLINARV